MSVEYSLGNDLSQAPSHCPTTMKQMKGMKRILPWRSAPRVAPADSLHFLHLRHVSWILIAGLALLLPPGRVDAQLRPDLDWRSLSTEHFRAHFTP
ncbi:MAG TPA: hypothetical protein VGD77_16095, partial [Gemmatimonadaceae bacterium]